MKIKAFIFLITLILISSCSTSKAVKYLKEGEIDQENFKVTFPFEIKKGWIVVPVEIENKKYKFLLDTGTPTLVSKELAKSFGGENQSINRFGRCIRSSHGSSRFAKGWIGRRPIQLSPHACDGTQCSRGNWKCSRSRCLYITVR